MKYLWIAVLVMGCSSSKNKLTQDKKCLEVVSKKKIMAPKDVKSMGVFSNITKEGELLSGYKIRIVKRKGFCQALILEFDKGIEPNLYAVSNLFECKEKLQNISLVTKLGFKSPYTEVEPEDFYFGLDGRVLKNNIVGHISFPENDLKDRPAKTKVQMDAGVKDETSMAGFDWEIIERLKMMKSCYY